MNRGQIYERKKDFIENDIANVLLAKRDFNKVQYAHSNSTEGEYIRICDIMGRSLTLDITALDLEQILEEVCRVILVNDKKASMPNNIIHDIDKLRSIAPLFK